jgi:hypothetical protein
VLPFFSYHTPKVSRSLFPKPDSRLVENVLAPFILPPVVSRRYAPHPMNHEYCETKRNLQRVWQDKSEAFSKGLGELVEKVGRIRPNEYKHAQFEVEFLRRSSVEARTTYESHVAEHEC